MKKINTLIKILKSDKKTFMDTLFYLLRKWNLLNVFSDKLFIRFGYYCRFGECLDLSNPKSFNQKLNWLKLYGRKIEYSALVDKFEVKKYVGNIIGSQYIIPTLAIWNKIEDINWNELPDEFIIKCTHDSHSYSICKNKLDFNFEATKLMLSQKMKSNLYWWAREWPYKNVKPRIIVEKLLTDSSAEDLKDYKFFCFNGKVKCFKIDFDRFSQHRANYYDINCNLMDIGEEICPPDYEREITIPGNIGEMIYLSEKLAAGIPFVRIDFYNVNNKIYFGEMTFFPAEGWGRFIDKKNDYTLGSWINLENIK